jgi:hypothetical protein
MTLHLAKAFLIFVLPYADVWGILSHGWAGLAPTLSECPHLRLASVRTYRIEVVRMRKRILVTFNFRSRERFILILITLQNQVVRKAFLILST